MLRAQGNDLYTINSKHKMNTAKQNQELIEAAKPLMEYLKSNHPNGVKILITSQTIEVQLVKQLIILNG